MVMKQSRWWCSIIDLTSTLQELESYHMPLIAMTGTEMMLELESSKNLLIFNNTLWLHFSGFYWRNGYMKQSCFFDVEELLT